MLILNFYDFLVHGVTLSIKTILMTTLKPKSTKPFSLQSVSRNKYKFFLPYF